MISHPGESYHVGGEEIGQYDTDPVTADTDGVVDGVEVDRGTDPLATPSPTPVQTTGGAGPTVLTTVLVGTGLLVFLWECANKLLR
jgi:hypothetical protein